MKKLMCAAMLLLGLGMMAVSCGNNATTQNNETSKAEKIIQPEAAVELVEAEPVDTRPRVYSCAYDGFVSIREEGSPRGAIIGSFKNGPEGAVLLEKGVEWTKIDCNGVVGYVNTKYVQDTPTIAYTGTATIDDIAGMYGADGYCLFLYFDGNYEVGYDWAFEYGKFIFQNDEVLLMPTSAFDPNSAEPFSPEGWLDADDPNFYRHLSQYVLPIDLAHHKIGDYEKRPFVTEKEIADAKAEYGEYWQEMIYGDYCSVGTLQEFKKRH